MTLHGHSHFPWLSRPGKFLSSIPRLSRSVVTQTHTCAGGQSLRWWREDSEDELLEVRDRSTIVSVVTELLGMLEPSPAVDPVDPRRCAINAWWWRLTAEAATTGRPQLMYGRCTADEFTCTAAAITHTTSVVSFTFTKTKTKTKTIVN